MSTQSYIHAIEYWRESLELVALIEAYLAIQNGLNETFEKDGSWRLKWLKGKIDPSLSLMGNNKSLNKIKHTKKQDRFPIQPLNSCDFGYDISTASFDRGVPFVSMMGSNMWLAMQSPTRT